MAYMNFFYLKSNSKPKVRIDKMHEFIGTLIWMGMDMGMATPDPSFRL